MIDYSKGKIYKIVCMTTGATYYGSTCDTLNSRLSKHLYDFKKFIKGEKLKYYSSFEVLKSDNYEISLVENVNCNTKKELLLRERFIIQNNTNVNILYATITPERLNDIITRNRENQRKHYKNNLPKYKEYTKKYRAQNVELCLERGKKWRENNINHSFEKHLCECGGQYATKHKSTHLKTKIHLLFVENKK
jgi:hypothetical protein